MFFLAFVRYQSSILRESWSLPVLNHLSISSTIQLYNGLFFIIIARQHTKICWHKVQCMHTIAYTTVNIATATTSPCFFAYFFIFLLLHYVYIRCSNSIYCKDTKASTCFQISSCHWRALLCWCVIALSHFLLCWFVAKLKKCCVVALQI